MADTHWVHHKLPTPDFLTPSLREVEIIRARVEDIKTVEGKKSFS